MVELSVLYPILTLTSQLPPLVLTSPVVLQLLVLTSPVVLRLLVLTSLQLLVLTSKLVRVANTSLTLGAHGQRGLQYLVNVYVCLSMTILAL